MTGASYIQPLYTIDEMRLSGHRGALSGGPLMEGYQLEEKQFIYSTSLPPSLIPPNLFTVLPFNA